MTCVHLSVEFTHINMSEKITTADGTTHRYEVVSTADFEDTVTAVSGSAHTALFDAWLRRAPLPALPATPAPTRPVRSLRA